MGESPSLSPVGRLLFEKQVVTYYLSASQGLAFFLQGPQSKTPAVTFPHSYSGGLRGCVGECSSYREGVLSPHQQVPFPGLSQRAPQGCS